jgi:hypothetical protein
MHGDEALNGCGDSSGVLPLVTLFAWFISHQPIVLFSQTKPATNNKPAVLFSQNKPAPAISQTNRLSNAYASIMVILIQNPIDSAFLPPD